jgi:putative FmdB family regulatory protein
MPLYEFACPRCQHTFEELVWHGEPVTCPQCHHDKVRRQLSVPAPPVVKVQCPSRPMACSSKAPPCGPGCCKV